MSEITPYTIEHHIEVHADQDLYIVHGARGVDAVLHFDAVLDEIERIVIELVGRLALAESYLDNELTAVKASRGTLAAYDTLCNLRDKLRAVCDEQGERAVADLSPQLLGLEGHRVMVVDRHGESRRFIVGTSVGWMPRHLENPAGHTAEREYETVTDLGEPR